MSEWNDEEIFRLVREMPRGRARSGFTDRVMARVDRARRRSILSRPLAVTLVLVLVTGLGAVLWTWPERQELLERRERLERLREEYRALESELRELRALAAEHRPVIELGGTSEVDFVLDVRELATRKPLQSSPVSHMERMR